MEIGNRKECLHDYASFPEEVPSSRFERQPNVSPHAKRKKNDNQGAKRSWIETPNMDDNREAKMGFGDEIPKQVWAAAQRNPMRSIKKTTIRERSDP